MKNLTIVLVLGKSVAATKKNNDYLKGVTSKMKSAMENILLYIQQDETSLAVPSFDKDSTGQDASATDGYVSVVFCFIKMIKFNIFAKLL